MKRTVIDLGPLPLEVPSWLAHATAETMREEPFPLREILDGALYYPSCGSDGGPVQYLGPWYQSFVYVDYGYGREDFLKQLVNAPFVGYQIMGMRSVSLNELAPRGWDQSALTQEENEDALRYARDWRKKPFCEWVVFERAASRTSSQGPQRFSLLYLCADGAQAFNTLYVSNKLRPGAIAVIQPGHAFGRNWTDFTDSQAVLARVVMGNPAGVPDYYVYGGRGAREAYTDPWPSYPKNVGWYVYWYEYRTLGNVGIWRA
ncbi:MAG: hypothetical protein Q7U05_03095 [Polaromonas sp.]|nr:hypothetical protein [Polaromonas sp.]